MTLFSIQFHQKNRYHMDYAFSHKKSAVIQFTINFSCHKDLPSLKETQSDILKNEI